MMQWALALIVLLPGSDPQQVSVGYLASEELCMLAGAGIAGAITKAEPTAAVGWKCTKGDEA